MITKVSLLSSLQGTATVSLLKSGKEEWSCILHTATATELFLNANSYVDHHALCTPAMLLRRKKELLFPDLVAIESGQSEWY